jgi:hypothetical protein
MVFPFGKPRRVYTRRRDYLSSFGTTRLPSLCRLIITSGGGGGTTTTTTKQGVLAGARCWLVFLLAAGVCLLCVFCVCFFAALFSFYRHERAPFLQPCSSIIAAFYSLLSLLLVLVSSCSSYTYFVGLF